MHFFFFFFGLCPWCMEVPRPGIKPAPQQWPELRVIKLGPQLCTTREVQNADFDSVSLQWVLRLWIPTSSWSRNGISNSQCHHDIQNSCEHTYSFQVDKPQGDVNQLMISECLDESSPVGGSRFGPGRNLPLETWYLGIEAECLRPDRWGLWADWGHNGGTWFLKEWWVVWSGGAASKRQIER